MKSDPLNQNVIIRIIEHMNHEHQEALIELAKRYGGIPKPSQAKMVELTPLAMQLEVDGAIIDISFDHKLSDSADAHRSLVAMLQSCRESS